MTMSRRKMGRRRGKSGVSDIIGTILILAITVTLFSSIFFFVSSLPGPPGQSNAQFSASLGLGTNDHLAFVNITYITGPAQASTVTQIYVSSAEHLGGFAPGAYTIGNGLSGATEWTAGQTWVLPVPVPYLASTDNITVTIVNIQSSVELFHSVLPGSIANPPPEFITEGYTPSPVVSTTPFDVWAQIHDPTLKANSIYASFSSVPGAAPVAGVWKIPGCECMNLSLNPTTGTWNLFEDVYSSSSSTLGNTYPVTLNATDALGQTNSVVVYVSFQASQGASLVVTLSATPGNPTIGLNTTITATVTNSGPVGGSGTFTFSATNGNFCPSQTACTQHNEFNVTTPISAFATDVLVTCSWAAFGADSIGDGPATITLAVTLPHSPIAPLTLTVYPKTVLIDGTGIAQGSLGDPFTYLTTDFISANIPYTSLIAPPGSSTITWQVNSLATDLSIYNLVIWDAGNATGSSACLSAQDALALGNAVNGGVGGWLIGSDVFNTVACSTAASYTTYFGASATVTSQGGSSTSLATPSSPVVSTIGYPASMDLGPSAYYSVLTPGSGAMPYLTTTSGSILALDYPASTPRANSFSSGFDLAVLSALMNGGPYSQIGTSPGAQASLVYDVFSWLAGFVTTSSGIVVNTDSGTDWAVSGVAVVPTSPAYQSSSYVNVTVRDNGIAGGIPIEAELLVNDVPYPTSGAPDNVYITPAKEGGSATGSIRWQPNLIGYVTICVEILPPSNDSNPTNNIQCSSLFSVQVYIGYSVLVVDNSQMDLGAPGPNITATQIVPALRAAQFPAATINVTYITKICGALAANPTKYNLVVWTDGLTTATFKPGGTSYCPLTNGNAASLLNFLVAGGLQSSLLFIGPGLMTSPANATGATSFITTYLGTTVTAALASAAPTSIIGRTSDPEGDGMNIPESAGGVTANNYTCSATGTGQTSFYYNGSIDFWTAGQCAGTEVVGSTGWHAAYWGWNLAGTTNRNLLDLATLKTATFFGRLLPNTDAIVDTPDVTFAQVSHTWINFDNIHPQLEQQYLVQLNVTNLGGAVAPSVAVSVYDGSHILSSQTVSVAASSESSTTGVVTPGIGSYSVPWVPIYSGVNTITVKITSSTAGQILPGVGYFARGNVTVYFFYDLTNGNTNAWSHSQINLQQTGYNPHSCVPEAASTGINLWDNTSVAKQWPGFSGCSPASPGSDSWGIDTTTGYCYITTEGGCSSLGIIDSTAASATTECSVKYGSSTYSISNYCGSVSWQFSSPISVPATGTGMVAAVASWDQKFSLAAEANGGVVCVTTSPSNLPNGGAGSGASNPDTPAPFVDMSNCVTNSPSPTPTDSQTTVEVPTDIDLYACGSSVCGSITCQAIPAFTGASAGGTFGWTPESLNLTQYAGTTVYLAFGFVQGSYNECEGLSSAPTTASPNGWYIDNLQVSFSSNSQFPTYTSGVNPVPSDLWGIYSASQLATTDGGTTTGNGAGAPPTGSAWVDGAWSGSSGTVMLDANMWDQLTSRPIDLSSAVNANLTFNWLWSGVFWVMGWTPCGYYFPMAPAQGLELEVSVANSGNWVPVWSSNGQYYGGTCSSSGWQHAPTTVGSTYSSYNEYEGASGYTSNDVVQVTTWGWRPAYINMNGYVGQVIQLRFIVGTNAGGDGSSSNGLTNTCFPMTTFSGNNCNYNTPIMSGAMISGIYITGNTSITPGPGPDLLGAQLSPAGPSAAARMISPAMTLGLQPSTSGELPGTSAGPATASSVPFSDQGQLIATPVPMVRIR